MCVLDPERLRMSFSPRALARRGSAALALTLAGCSTSPGTGKGPPTGAGSDAGSGGTGVDLPILQAADAAAAARGESQFTTHVLGQGIIPVEAITSLWLVWGTGSFPNADAYWAAFRARYGFYEAPFDNGPYPMGIRTVDGATVTVDCLAC